MISAKLMTRGGTLMVRIILNSDSPSRILEGNFCIFSWSGEGQQILLRLFFLVAVCSQSFGRLNKYPILAGVLLLNCTHGRMRAIASISHVCPMIVAQAQHIYLASVKKYIAK